MPEEIRPAGPADRAAVEGVVQDAYRPWVERVGGRPQPMDADYAALIAAGQVHVTGADAIDGLIVLVPEPGVLLVENVAVRPELHGKGIGRRLLAFAEELAGRLGLPELRLYTHEKMESNIALYERLGYAETAREAIHVGHIVHMRKPTRGLP